MLSDELLEIKQVLERFDGIDIAIVFGSIAKQTALATSDLDVAVSFNMPLDIETKIRLIEALALATGRPIDLVDLKEVGEPLLGQILQHGIWLLGSSLQKGALLSQHLIDTADFAPYQARTLTERRSAWISK